MPNTPFSNRSSMLRALAVAAVVVSGALWAPSAFSASYFIRADGNDANSGTTNSSTGSWRTLSKANTVLRAGDIVRVISLNTADSSSSTLNHINPTADGTSASGGAGLITYLGDTANPTSLPVYRITVGKSWILVRGFRSRNGSRLGGTANTVHSSIQDCVITQQTVGQNPVEILGAQYSSMRRNRMVLYPPTTQYGALIVAGRDGLGQSPRASFDTLSQNIIVFPHVHADNRAFWVRGHTNNCVFEHNKVKFVFNSSGSAGFATGLGLGVYESFGNYYHDNKWEADAVNNNGTNARWFGAVTRSGTHHNLFERDTFYTHLNTPSSVQGIEILMSEANALPESLASMQVHSNTWRSCFFKTAKGSFEFQHWANNTTIENCVFINDSNAGLLIPMIVGSRIRHNTFFGTRAEALSHQSTISGNNLVEGNIFMSNGASGCSRGVQQWGSSTGFNQDRNLFFSTSAGGSSAVRAGGSCYSVGSGTTWCSTLNHDCNSKWGDPRFVNAAFAGFDPHLLSGSAAVDSRFPDGYAGAVGPSGPDATPPAAISDLASSVVSNNLAVVTWTAPGDDGTSGNATSYEMRRSNSPITSANFASAILVNPGPVVAPSGTPQEFMILGLFPSTTYYVAVKTIDDAGNSSLSNVASFTTTANDVMAPGTVNDLSTSP